MNNYTVFSSSKMGVRFYKILRNSIIAGFISIFLNITYCLLYTSLFKGEIPEFVNISYITITSMLPMMFAALFYYLLLQYARNPNMIFIIVSLFATVASLILPLMPTLPNGIHTPPGFLAIAAPMHIIIGIACMLIIPACRVCKTCSGCKNR